MSTHEEYEQIAVMIDSGASETEASVEKFELYPIEKTAASGTTYSSAAGKQAEDIVNVCQRYIRVVDDHGPGVGPSSRCAEDSAKTRYWEASADGWNLDTRWCSDTQTTKGYVQATGRTCGSTAGPASLICGQKETQDQINSNKRPVLTGGACDE